MDEEIAKMERNMLHIKKGGKWSGEIIWVQSVFYEMILNSF